MAHDEFNSGARHGFCMAKLAVRDVDRQIEYPDHYERDQKEFLKYHIQKDLLHKIYEAINKMMEEEVHENDY
tara:strand:+ start:6921 stop:7136 length:216 start_codon:yes stop_codon:yes gene_type:complete